MIKYVKNSLWMLSEQMLKVISAIFVGVYVARYLGPEQFGQLSYALAIVGVFLAISRLGMDSILVRDLAKYTVKVQAYMGTAFALMLVAACAGLAILTLLLYFFENDYQTTIYTWLIATGLLFQVFIVIDYGFQAKVQAKFSSIAKSIALAIGSLIKIVLVLNDAELFAFVIAYALDYFIIAATLLVTHFVKRQPGFFLHYERALVAPLLKSAWPMVLSTLAATLYMRVDQIMIKNILDTQQLGLYAAATKIYDGWIIIPYIISISLLPAITKNRAESPHTYEQNLTKLFALVFWMGVAAAAIATLYADDIMFLTFGSAFGAASTVLVIVMWTAAFTALGSVSARYFVVENMEKKIAFRTFVALGINVILNILLIPSYGIEGAAYATLFTIIFANYMINYFDRQLKALLRMENSAIFYWATVPFKRKIGD